MCAGPWPLHVRIDDGALETGKGPLDDPDLAIEAGPAIRALLAGQITPVEALASGAVHITADPELLVRFVEVFQIPPSPVSPNGPDI